MADYSLSNKIFGANITITIFDIEQDIAEMLAEDAYREGLRLQKIFNIYDKESEISLLNKKRTLTCSKELIYLTQTALEFCETTNGLYDISLGLKFMSRKKKGKEKNPQCSYKNIVINKNKIKLTHEDVWIDLGSIAKGYIVDNIVDFLKKNGVEAGLVDGRGDIKVFGEKKHEIDIQDPRNKQNIAATVKIADEAIATSGDYNQFKDGFETSHIINNHYTSSVTIIAKTLEIADAFATIISVMEKEKIQSLLEKRTDLKAVIIDKQSHISYYNMGEI